MKGSQEARQAGYDRRKAANSHSKTTAEHDRERWSEDELEILLNFWRDGITPEKDVAETLGRTIEACREQYLKRTKNLAAEPVVVKELKEASRWDRGFTSLDEMGY